MPLTEEERKERKRDKMRRWRKANPKRAYEYARDYQKSHPEQTKAKKAKYRATSKGKIKEAEYDKKYTQEHRDQKNKTNLACYYRNRTERCRRNRIENNGTKYQAITLGYRHIQHKWHFNIKGHDHDIYSGQTIRFLDTDMTVTFTNRKQDEENGKTTFIEAWII
jgi:glucosamine 6-phosphate synthetase-like amidotransferase/phosphosugar isomerase protein